MDTKPIKILFVRAMYFMVVVALMFSMTGQVGAQEATPRIEAFAWFDRYSLVDWPADVPIEITIQNPAYNTTFTPDGSSNWYDLFPGVDLQPGTVITATNGETTKVLELSPLSATADPVTGIVTGVATPDRTFHMRIEADHFQFPIEQDIESDPAGNWSVTIGSDLPWVWLTRGLMWEWDDDGDVTQAIWHVHNELVEVWLAQNELRAFGWPLNTELTFSVDGNDIATAFTQPVDWIDGTSAVVNAGDLRLEPGMTVMVTDGITSTSTIIQDLKITHADPDNDLVYGYAPSNASLELGSSEDDPHFRFFNAGADGGWIVDYSTPSLNGVTVDVNLGDTFTLFMREDDKDATVWEWNVTNPHFVVFPEWEWFDGLDWPNGAMVTITVEGKPECETTKESWDNFFNGSFGEGCDLMIGDTVTFTDGFTTRTHTVRNLSITGVNQDTEIVYGVADEGATVYVWPHATGQQLDLTAGSGGIWQTDFTGIFDIAPGEGGRAEIRDDAGNATAVDWYVPNPHFAVFPEWESIEGWEWPAGAVVHLTIEDPATLQSPDYSGDEPVGPTPWDPNQLWVQFNFANTYDMKPGDIVTLDDSVTARTHTVRNLGITAVDREANTVAGIADVDETVYVWPHATGQQLQATVGASGTWQVDFTGIFDLVPNECGRSEIRDEAGNATAVDWCVPPPVTGFHDYNSGDVPSWACNAGGWAMDPDSAFEDVNVRILVDGVPVVEDVKAENYREDLETAWNEGGGGCPGGTCAFEVSLWDIISHYVAHEITVEAQDLQTGEWYSLNETPKTINCRTYDIYTFDPATGETRQITNLMDTDEYDPSWSPNGKKIVHDVVSSDGFHGLYVTDVRTHVSTPLVGGEDGGNDAAWSPSGKWIAFDRRWVGEPNIYLVPATGGPQQLVRSDAVRADWAPNSKRIVFQQPSDESIRTVAVDGGRGEETLIAPNGADPAWSPDGNWIAYVYDGNIWKVQVNILGRVLGNPIQVTNVAGWNMGSPTWSPDSQTIIFNGGVNDIFDIWKVSALGGDPVWLSGSPNYGDYGPENARNSSSIAFAAVSP